MRLNAEMATQKAKKKRPRLKDMQPFEIGAVPAGANRRFGFISLKQENGMKIDLANLEKAQEQLGRIVMVVKSGELTAEAQQDVAAKFGEFLALFGDVQLPPTSTDPEAGEVSPNPADLKSDLEELKSNLSNVMLASGVSDLAVDEQIDAVQAQIDEVIGKLDAPAPAQAEEQEAATADTAEAASTEETETAEAAATAEAASAEEATQEAAATEEAAAETAETETAESEEAGEADAEKAKAKTQEATSEEPAQVTFTAEDMKEMFSSFADGMKEVMKEAVTGAVKQVSKQMAHTPSVIPAGDTGLGLEEFDLDSPDGDCDGDLDFNDWIDKDDAK